MTYEVQQHWDYPDVWIAGAIGADADIYIAEFIGPDAESRAREYAAWKEISSE